MKQKLIQDNKNENSPLIIVKGKNELEEKKLAEEEEYKYLVPLSSEYNNWIKYGLSLFMFGLLVAQSIGLISILCEVDAIIKIDGELFRTIPVIQFTFKQMVYDFWKAGGWSITILIIISTILPLIKLTSLLILWLIPLPISLKSRWRILFILDILGHLFIANIIFIAYVVISLDNDVTIANIIDVSLVSNVPIKGVIFGGTISFCVQIIGQLFLAFEDKDSHSNIDFNLNYYEGIMLTKYPKMFFTNIISVIGFVICYVSSLINTLSTFKFGGAAGSFITESKNFTILSLIKEFPEHIDDYPGGVFFSSILVISLLVAPKCMHQPESPAASAIAFVNAIMSCLVSLSISSTLSAVTISGFAISATLS